VLQRCVGLTFPLAAEIKNKDHKTVSGNFAYFTVTRNRDFRQGFSTRVRLGVQSHSVVKRV
jgi:hypothetical protein